VTYIINAVKSYAIVKETDVAERDVTGLCEVPVF
jgi:hypothetical protein